MITDQEAIVWMTKEKAYRELSGNFCSMWPVSVLEDNAEYAKNCQ